MTPNYLAFSGAGSKGDSVLPCDLYVEFGRQKIYLSLHFVETPPTGIDMIMGLDNDITIADLEDSLTSFRNKKA